ncbi:MAG: MinD/ParA family protein [Alphaproteobacteria bacterium]|nr:MinD/ParA family protein [Alphaproteobacteria bacterium]
MTSISAGTMIESLSHIMLIASGKGGVGKTWFSISYAHGLAKKGKKVLLLDGDIGLANIDIQLGIMPQKDLTHYINGECLLKDCVIPYGEGGFDILVGRSGCSQLSSLSVARMADFQSEITQLADRYDQVIIDLGAGLGSTVQKLSQLASQCIVITTDEPSSMTDAYAVIKYLRNYLSHIRVHIVVNQVLGIADGEKIYQNFKKVCLNFMGYTPELAGIIPKDSHVTDAIRNQQPLFQRHPHAMAATQIEKIIWNMSKNCK